MKRGIFVGLIMITVVVLSGLVLAYGLFDIGTSTSDTKHQKVSSSSTPYLSFTRPSKGGGCTPGTKACMEDLGFPPIRACEYECGAGGTWKPGTECDTNMCNGGECHQGGTVE